MSTSTPGLPWPLPPAPASAPTKSSARSVSAGWARCTGQTTRVSNGLHSGYVRGEALLAAHRYAEAATEFQKILDHRGIVGADPIGALAHLQLGRTFALSGDKIKAKTAYQDFLALWKDTDPDVPILRQAKAEYARLR